MICFCPVLYIHKFKASYLNRDNHSNISCSTSKNQLKNTFPGKPKNGQTPNRAWLLVVRTFNNVPNIQTQQMLQEMARKRRRRAKEERNSRQKLMVHHLMICTHPKFRSEHQKERRDQRLEYHMESRKR